MQFDEEINDGEEFSSIAHDIETNEIQYDRTKKPGEQATIQQAEAAWRAHTKREHHQHDDVDEGFRRPLERRTEEPPHMDAGDYFPPLHDKLCFNVRVFMQGPVGRLLTYYEGENSDLTHGYDLCPMLTVVGDAIGRDGQEALVIQYRDRFKVVRNLAIPRALIAEGGSKLAAFLSANAFDVPPGKKLREVVQLLLHELHGPRVTIARSTGWHGGVFVLPNRVVGSTGDTRIIAELSDNLKLSQCGSFETWRRDGAALCKNNSRLQLGLSLAFASVLLPFAPSVTQVVCHFFGPSSIGKSTLGTTAGSVWGGGDGPLGYAESWNGTMNAQTAKAAMRSNTLNVLDEIRLGTSITATAYALSSGQSRGRLDKSANLRAEDKFSVFTLSSGEVTLEEQERSSSPRGPSQVFDGAELRLPSIPADAQAGYGLFEDLHDFGTAAQLADHLQKVSRENYGHAGPLFVERLLEHIGTFDKQATFSVSLAKKIDRFVGSLELAPNADDAVKRLARTFGLIAAAGQLASDYDIIPVTAPEMAAGVRKCFNDWLVSRGGARSKTGTTALAALRDYIYKNMGRFVLTNEVSTSQQSVIAGYRQTNGKEDVVFYLPIATWKEVLASAPRAKLVEELDKLGLLIRQNSALTDTIVKKLSGGLTVRVYAVSSRILEVTDDGKLAGHDGQQADAEDGKVVELAAHAKRLVKAVRSSAR